MAFTVGELTRGALTASVAYVAMLLLVFLVPAAFERTTPGMTVVVLGMVIAYALPITLLAMLLGLAPAYLIGRALRTVRAVWVHLGVFAVYGALVAAATMAILLLTGFPFVSADAPAGVLLFVGPGAPAAAIGWWRAYRTATRVRSAGPRALVGHGPDDHAAP